MTYWNTEEEIEQDLAALSEISRQAAKFQLPELELPPLKTPNSPNPKSPPPPKSIYDYYDDDVPADASARAKLARKHFVSSFGRGYVMQQRPRRVNSDDFGMPPRVLEQISRDIRQAYANEMVEQCDAMEGSDMAPATDPDPRFKFKLANKSTPQAP